MPRQCTVCAHPKRKQIDEALLFGVSATAIADSHGIPSSNLYRHRSNGHIPRDEDKPEELEPETIGVRLVDLANDLRRERLTAQASNQKNTSLRAAAAELRVLDLLSARYGVERVQLLEELEEAKALYRALARFVRRNPALSPPLIQEIEAAALDDLAQTLQKNATKGITES